VGPSPRRVRSRPLVLGPRSRSANSGHQGPAACRIEETPVLTPCSISPRTSLPLARARHQRTQSEVHELKRTERGNRRAWGTPRDALAAACYAWSPDRCWVQRRVRGTRS
jgi:hypothetical protein